MRFLVLDIELGPEDGAWLVHQQSYIYAFLQEMFDPECLKDRRTPKARVKHPPLQPGQDPLELLLWVSLRTCPDSRHSQMKLVLVYVFDMLASI